MIKVGVTGGIGSGKTTFCKVWESLGAFVVYADDFAKKLMVTDQELISQIKETFGEHSYFGDGTLNRSFLAEEAFSKGRVDELNAIVHPILWKRMNELMQSKEKEGVQLYVKEAAILLQNGRPEELDLVILLLADQSKQIERVKERDQSDDQSVMDRISKQPDFKDLIPLADYVVTNDSDLEALEARARTLYQQILAGN